MISNNNYALEFEAILTEEGGIRQVRAIAENAVTKLTSEAHLSGDKAKSIIAQVYTEADHLKSAIEQLETGYPTVLRSSSNARCIFTSEQLVLFGFDPVDLKSSTSAH
jgi:hypothetical protein